MCVLIILFRGFVENVNNFHKKSFYLLYYTSCYSLFIRGKDFIIRFLLRVLSLLLFQWLFNIFKGIATISFNYIYFINVRSEAFFILYYLRNNKQYISVYKWRIELTTSKLQKKHFILINKVNLKVVSSIFIYKLKFIDWLFLK